MSVRGVPSTLTPEHAAPSASATSPRTPSLRCSGQPTTGGEAESVPDALATSTAKKQKRDSAVPETRVVSNLGNATSPGLKDAAGGDECKSSNSPELQQGEAEEEDSRTTTTAK